MISFRHHIVSLVAVFLALAVGIALGGGPLSELGRDDRPASAPTRAQREANRSASYGDTFAAASAARLYDKGLKGRSVAVVAMPDADSDTVAALGPQIEAAGGSVATTYDVQPALLATNQKSLVDTLGSQLMTQLHTKEVDQNATTYVRIGQLLGLGITDSALKGADATSIRDSLAGAELMSSPDSAERADLVLVVLGGDADPTVLSGLSEGIASAAQGVVVLGDTASAAAGGTLARLRAESDSGAVATVDGDDTELGLVTATLALIRSLDEPGGSFGASGSDGAVPLP